MRLFALFVDMDSKRSKKSTGIVAGITPENGNCYCAQVPGLVLSDSNGESSLRLYEDGTELGPPHSIHDDIRQKGGGRYSHWNEYIYFSTSDNSDPRTNGRTYSYDYDLLYSLNNRILHMKRLFLIGPLVRLAAYPLRAINHIRLSCRNLPDFLLKAFFFYHQRLLGFVCRHADLLRKYLRPLKCSTEGTKKVLHATCSFDLGGTQRQIMNLCENSSDGDFVHQAIEYYPEYNYLYRKGISMEESRYVQGNFIARMIGRWTMNLSHRSQELLQAYKFFRDFQVIRPDIVVGWGHAETMVTFLAGAIARVPKIVFCIRTVNPSYYDLKLGHIIDAAHKKMAPLLDGIVVNSSLLQEDYSGWVKVAKDKILVCPNGIEPHPLTGKERLFHRNEIRSRYSISDNAIVLMNVGRFSKEKGQMLMAEAFKRLADKYGQDNLFCILCGDGPTKQEIEDFARTNSLKNIIFTGRTENVHLYLSAADIFVMPSDFEGMPNAMMEAMACGMPCVSTNKTGALDVARDGKEALYVDVGSVEQLFEKLCYLIDNPDERLRLGSNGRERLKEFSISKMVSLFNQHLETIVKG